MTRRFPTTGANNEALRSPRSGRLHRIAFAIAGKRAQSAARHLCWPLIVVLGGCAAQKPAGFAAIPVATKVSVERLDAMDRLKPDQMLYFEVADRASNGTVELFAPGESPATGGPRAVPRGADGTTASLDCKEPTAGGFVPCLVLSALAGATMPIWIVPAIIVSFNRSGSSQGQIDDEAAATAVELERHATVTRVREALAGEELLAKLDDAYTQTLRGALEQAAPTPGSPAGAAQSNASAREGETARVLSGLSRIAVVRDRKRDEWLTVCARTSTGSGDPPPRYFETCLSGPVAPEQYGSAEWMREALVSKTRQLAQSMAAALRGE